MLETKLSLQDVYNFNADYRTQFRNFCSVLKMTGVAICNATTSDATLLQPVWNVMRERPELLLSPLWSVTAGFMAHVLLSAPFFFCDLLSPRVEWIRRYKLTADTPDLSRWLQCLKRISLKYASGILPFSACVQLARRASLTETECAAPSLSIILSECFSCLLVFDTLFFVLHYMCHRNHWMYQMFHQDHHLNRDTFALAAQDSSLEELLLQQALAISSAMLIKCHPMSEILFHLSNIWLAVEYHCGYNLPWALHRILPCFGGSPSHYAHHRHLKGNYAPYFTHWDLIFGTSLQDVTDKRLVE